MSLIGEQMEYIEELKKLEEKKKKRSAKEIYYRNRESHLKAQKRYDDKNREKKHEYDKKRYIQKKEYEQEIERLNNIINELEKELKIAYHELSEYELVNGRDIINNTLNVLKELKESDNNE